MSAASPALPPVPADPAEPATPARPVAAPLRRRRFDLRGGQFILGLSWIHGEFHAATFRRQAQVAAWSAPQPVERLDELETALDQALAALDFTGTDVFLILEHDQFHHQSEQAPAFSESATRNFLKARVARLEQEKEPMLWVSQQVSSQRNEASVLLHLLAGSTYDQINRLMLGRRLELTRIVPLVVPLQAVIDRLPEAKDQPVLLAAPAGRATIAVAGRAQQPLLFTRSILSPWNAEPSRIAVELNRSLLYAKQQFGAVIDRIRLLGDPRPELLNEVRTRCATAKDLAAFTSGPFEWMDAVARLPARHPINLVAGYLSFKQRQRLLRRFLVAACWLALVLGALDVSLRSQSRLQEEERLLSLQESQEFLEAERDRLEARNALGEKQTLMLAEADRLRLPPIPVHFLTAVASLLPTEARLTQLQVRPRDSGQGWIMRLEGIIETDEDSAREHLRSFERQLARSVVRARIPATGRAAVLLPPEGDRTTPALRFVLEGGLLED
jgi:hypothetical protein